MHRPHTVRAAHYLLIAAGVLISFAFYVSDYFGMVCLLYPDDAMFYHIVARNLAAGIGPTSDGIGFSNGFHPLWAVLLTLLSCMFDNIILPVVVLQYVLSAGTLFIFYHVLIRYVHHSIAVCAVFVATFEPSFAVQLMYNGMESGLALFFLMCILLALQRDLSRLPRRILLGGLFCLLFFSRLDGGLMSAAFVGAVLLFSGRPFRERAGLIVSVLALPSLLAAGYLFFNLFYFETAIPISGVIKALPQGSIHLPGLYPVVKLFFLNIFSVPLRAIFGFSIYGSSPINYLYLAAVAGILTFAAVLLKKQKKLDFAIVSLFVYLVVHSAYYLFLQSDTYSLNWVKAPQVVMLYISIAVLLSSMLQALQPVTSLRSAQIPACIAFLLIATGYNYIRSTKTGRIADYGLAIKDFRSALLFIENNIPESAGFVSRNIGFFGYLSRRPVVSYDGLLNSYEYYADYKSKGRQAEYLRLHNIDYAIQAVPEKQDARSGIAEQFSGIDESDIDSVVIFDNGIKEYCVSKKYVLARFVWADCMSKKPIVAKAADPAF